MSYTKKNLRDVEDSAPRFGFAELGEAHFAGEDLEAEKTGVTYLVLRPGKRQAFGHKHEDAEEVYVVIAGSGRAKLNDEIIDLELRDALRVAPNVTRAFEAGDDGLEVLAVGAHHPKDGELDHDFWKD